METENLEQETTEVIPGGVPEIDERQILLAEKDAEIDALKKELDESAKRLLNISVALSDTEIRLALLLAGAAKEKLAEAFSRVRRLRRVYANRVKLPRKRRLKLSRLTRI